MLKEKNWLYWIYLTGFGAFFGRVWSLALFFDNVGLRSGWIASWADGAAHLSFMSSFAYRSMFPSTHPLFLGKGFSYPYIADLIGGYLVKAGLPLHTSYNLLGFLLSMFLVVMVWKLFETLFKDKIAPLMGSLVFFLGAGLTGLERLVSSNIKPIFDTYDWVDIISAQIMPQRALILGMPVGIMIFIVIYKYISANKNVLVNTKHLFAVGVLTGLMSIVHAHSLIALLFLVGWLFTLDLKRKKTIRVGWFWYGVPAITLSTALILRQVGSFDENFLRFLPFWIVNSKNENLFWFWLKSWGVWPVVAYAGYASLKKNLKILFVPLVILFLLLNIITFQPYDWDNTKLFLWIYLFFSGAAGVWLAQTWKKKRLLVASLLVLLTFSGAMDAGKLLLPQDDPILYLFTHEDMVLASRIRDNTDEKSVFVTSSYHLNPVPVLTGRQILMGYPGWLWTYGIKYQNRLEEIETIYAGGEKAEELIDKYLVSYVVFDEIVSASEKNSYEEYFEKLYTKPFENNAYRVYEVRKWESLNNSAY